MSHQDYFANKEPRELAAELEQLVSASHSMHTTWNRNLHFYYSTLSSGDSESALEFVGSQQEVVKVKVPQARSLIRQMVSLVTKQRSAFTPIAMSTEGNVLSDTKLIKALLDQVVREQSVDDKGERAAEHAAVLGVGWLKCVWNPYKGQPRGADEDGGVYYTGDVDIACVDAYDVIYDYSVSDLDCLDWIIIRTTQNKFDLAAKAKDPDLKKKILALSQPTTTAGSGLNESGMLKNSVSVYEFYHKATPAVPNGRISHFCSADVVLHDELENPYDCLPIIPIRPEALFKTGFGYPIISSLIPMQEMFDSTISTIATNQAAFGIQSVLVPKGSDISVSDLSSGMRVIEYQIMTADGGGEPKALQLTSTPAEVFNFADMLHANMQEISNINSALRGSPPPGVTSGVALTTLTTNALEFTQSFTKAYVVGLEKLMTLAILCYKKFARIERVVEMTGRNKQTMAKTFVGDDLASISRIAVTVSNPLAATAAGRQQIAGDLLKAGLIRNTAQYFEAIETGNIEILFDKELAEQMLIENENDDLRSHKSCIVASLDDHPSHISSHAALLNDPSIRRSGTMVETILSHILEHQRQMTEVDPGLWSMVRSGKPPGAGGGAPPGAQQQ